MATEHWIKPWTFAGEDVRCALAPRCQEHATFVAGFEYDRIGHTTTMRKPACAAHAAKFAEKLGLREKGAS